MNRRRLFLYGTLWTGTGDPRLERLVRRCCHPLGPATVAGTLYALAGYPGLRAGRGRVRGLLVTVHSSACLRHLDRYEDYDPADPGASLFLRRRTVARLDAGGPFQSCWVYVYNRPVAPARRIRAGDYRRYLQAGR